MPVAEVYPHYVAKAERKGHTEAEVREVITWLTGFDDVALDTHLRERTSFEDFFAAATLTPHASAITGSICGVRVQDIEDPLMWRIRCLDKLVDEVAAGRPMDRIKRS